MRIKKFELKRDFLDEFVGKEPEFGFNGLGKFTFMRTYSRIKENGKNEAFWEVVTRVVNGTFTIIKKHMISNGLPWNENAMRDLARTMYRKIFAFKMTPPGRGFWAMGSRLTEEDDMFAALQNCAFTSTKDDFIARDVAKPFRFLMDLSMLGVGVGFDTRGANVRVPVKGPMQYQEEFVIHDSREGWVDSVGYLIDSYVKCGPEPVFDYGHIRGAGEPIKGFGGVSSGPEPLRELHEGIRSVLARREGKTFDVRSIVDIMNMIGRCVIAGNVRRTAEIAFGDPEDTEFLNLKNYDENPERQAYGWASNNSIFAQVGQEYYAPANRIQDNGEPGFAWLENMKKYGRMGDPANWDDAKAQGGNPCLEQTLEDKEMCTLVEVFVDNADNLNDFKQNLGIAFLYAKAVTLTQTHWTESNEVMLKNRRIGTSVTGTAQFIANNSVGKLNRWLDEGYEAVQGYDEHLSEMFGVPRSIKTTSVKPSGTVSLVAGSTPGMHWPEARHYIRRVRVSKNSPLIEPLREAGHHVEEDVHDPTSMVAEFYVSLEDDVRTLDEVSMWEQMSMAALLQRVWSDNQVSCTVTFDPETEGDQIAHALDYFQFQLKGISFLPRSEDRTVYEQAPYEKADPEFICEKNEKVKPIDFSGVIDNEPEPDKYCSGKSCRI